MSATNTFETALLEHYFINSDHPDIGDASGLQNSTTAGDFYISLHTANPGESGDQDTSEATYTDYARVPVERSGSGWSISGDEVSNVAAITFPTCTGGSDTITHFGVGSDSTGSGNLFWYGVLTAPLNVSNGITPSYAIGMLKITLD